MASVKDTLLEAIKNAAAGKIPRAGLKYEAETGHVSVRTMGKPRIEKALGELEGEGVVLVHSRENDHVFVTPALIVNHHSPPEETDPPTPEVSEGEEEMAAKKKVARKKVAKKAARKKAPAKREDRRVAVECSASNVKEGFCLSGSGKEVNPGKAFTQGGDARYAGYLKRIISGTATAEERKIAFHKYALSHPKVVDSKHMQELIKEAKKAS
jgi:hypothetical protein